MRLPKSETETGASPCARLRSRRLRPYAPSGREEAHPRDLLTHPSGRSHWLETGLVERAHEELDIPITHVIVDLGRQEVEIRLLDAERAARRTVGYER